MRLFVRVRRECGVGNLECRPILRDNAAPNWLTVAVANEGAVISVRVVVPSSNEPIDLNVIEQFIAGAKLQLILNGVIDRSCACAEHGTSASLRIGIEANSRNGSCGTRRT